MYDDPDDFSAWLNDPEHQGAVPEGAPLHGLARELGSFWDSEQHPLVLAEDELRGGRPKAAIRLASSVALCGDPQERAPAYCLWADALMDLDQLDGAEAAYRAALVCVPGSPEALFGMALLHGQRGDAPAAGRFALVALENACADADLLSRLAPQIAGFLDGLDMRAAVLATMQRIGWEPALTATWLDTLL
ncbi:hypothetical protein [Miltoncostaea oceani]|uniref:hypothetical protein n=1 Tax=Miltoncostaea oceani TaxID=2843216 RepID=UPI001C3CC5D7|nr:hypothetical protein [Miltoncostaea oceani]